jgi:hypothetical protein
MKKSNSTIKSKPKKAMSKPKSTKTPAKKIIRFRPGNDLAGKV